MAGRKPQPRADEQAGANPLRPPRGTARANKNFVNGLGSQRAIADRAEAFYRALMLDPRCPLYLHSAAFAQSVMSWSQAEAVASLAYEHMERCLIEGGPDLIFALKPGVMRSVSEVWMAHAKFAMQLRSKLGIDPAAYARVSRDLNLAGNATEDRLQQMAQAGAAVTTKRLELVQGEVEAS